MDTASSNSAPSRQSWLLPFTGLIPVILILPPLIAGWWTAAIVVNLVASLSVIGFHLARRQGVTTFDLLVLGLGVANAILWFGFGNDALLRNFAVPIYAILAIQAVVSLRFGEPWTVQFAKRQVDPSLWKSPGFIAVNRQTTRWWAVGFAACALLALLPEPWGSIASTVMLVITVVRTPRIASRARARLEAGRA